LNKLRSV